MNTLGYRHVCGPISFDFSQGLGAPLADSWIAGVFADVG